MKVYDYSEFISVGEVIFTTAGGDETNEYRVDGRNKVVLATFYDNAGERIARLKLNRLIGENDKGSELGDAKKIIFFDRYGYNLKKLDAYVEQVIILNDSNKILLSGDRSDIQL
jgi:hypothetical protein